MATADHAAGTSTARIACLVALFCLVTVVLVLAGHDPPAWVLAMTAFAIALVARAIAIVSRGEVAGFVLLWLALGVLLGFGLIAIFSVGLLFLVAAALVGVAIATAPNRTGRSRAHPAYVAAQVAAFFITLSLPFVLW